MSDLCNIWSVIFREREPLLSVSANGLEELKHITAVASRHPREVESEHPPNISTLYKTYKTNMAPQNPVPGRLGKNLVFRESTQFSFISRHCQLFEEPLKENRVSYHQYEHHKMCQRFLRHSMFTAVVPCDMITPLALLPIDPAWPFPTIGFPHISQPPQPYQKANHGFFKARNHSGWGAIWLNGWDIPIPYHP